MASDGEEKLLEFHEMGLDDRLLKAIAKLGWAKPTPIQERAIPLALEGKDVLARARTGSGKTAAYAVPLIQKMLQDKKRAKEQLVRALVMTPTRELCNQATTNIKQLCDSCSREVKCLDVSAQASLDVHKPALMEKPDIIIGTPSRILAHVQAGNLVLNTSVQMVVIDEADLVFSFGYQNDLKTLLGHLPQIYQAFLMSATLGDDVKTLKKMILHNPVILKLEESQLPETSQLTQYHIKCEEEDKFVLIYTLLKLNLIRGKTITFVNTVDRCYRLKLFLEYFGIPSCILNSELPVNSRCHIVQQFNEGKYSMIIAADETMLEDPTAGKNEKKHKKRKKDKESGVARGIDFQFVSNIVNFDFPTNSDAYVHRVGRTARGDNSGTALSFVSIKEMPLLTEVEEALAESHPEGETLFKPYNFKMEEIEGFRYRAKDAMRSVTKIAVKEARLKEIKQELLKSQQLKTYFEDNPRDLQVLRHDKTLHGATKGLGHLKHVPDYLIPRTLRGSPRREGGRQKRKFEQTQPSKGQMKFKKKKMDPLQSFAATGLLKKSSKKSKKK